MTKMRNWWKSLPFFWQVYLFMVVSFGGTITLVEGVLEPLAEYALTDIYATHPVQCEALLWLLGTFLPALLIGYLITRTVILKLDGLELATRTLSSGDLKVRMDESGNTREVFTRLAKNFNGMAESLERLIVNEKRLLADISHELRSPLTRMNLSIALLEKCRYDDGFEKNVRMLEAETGQMTELVKTLLEQGRERLALSGRARIDFSGLVLETVESFRIVGDASGRTIAADVAPGLAISGNFLRARMVVENILINAVFYTPDGGTVEVGARRNGANIVLSIRDRGPGVPPQHLEDIFRAFFRVDESRTRNSGGFGLGLTLVKESVLLMGGDVSAGNREPGLEVLVTLPFAE